MLIERAFNRKDRDELKQKSDEKECTYLNLRNF